ncbi:oligosaccharide flippase family protein [Sunxiuqinia elliptica]
MDKLFSKLYSILPVSLQKIWDRIEMSDIGSRMAKGAFWSLSGAVISKGLMLLASIIVARILGKTEYGELGMIRSTVNMFVVFAGFGLGMTATKYIAEYKEKDKIKTGKIIGLSTIFAGVSGGIIALIILIIAPYLANQTINAPHLVNELRLGAFMLFFSALNGSQTGTLAGFEAFKSIAKINLLSGLLAFPIQIIFTWFWGLTGSVIGYGTNFLLLWCLNFVTVRKESSKFNISINFADSWDEWSVLYKFSLPALLSGLLVSPVVWACNAILVNQPKGYDEMAIFDAANQWRTLVLFIPTVLSQIALPLFASSTEHHNRFVKILKINILANIFISSLIALTVSLFSKEIMQLYGNTFQEGWLVLVLLVSSSIFYTVGNILGKALAGKDKVWTDFSFNLLWAFSLLITAYFLLDKGYGAVGLAMANLFSYILFSSVKVIYIIRSKPFSSY